MPKLNELKLEIKTGTNRGPEKPSFSINGFPLEFDETDGGTEAGATFTAVGSPNSFPHSLVLMGPERGELSSQMMKRCDHVIRIPTAFCVNVAIAGALVMYDRLINLEGFPLRPMTPGAEPTPLPEHVRGAMRQRTKKKTNIPKKTNP